MASRFAAGDSRIIVRKLVVMSEHRGVGRGKAHAIRLHFDDNPKAMRNYYVSQEGWCSRFLIRLKMAMYA
jgi:hypothetical protein